MNNYILLCVILVLFSSLSQVLLKVAANKEYSNKLGFLINYRVLLAYAILLAITFINSYFIFSNLELTVISMIETLGYIFVPIISIVLLKEKINQRLIFGILFISLGCIIFLLT